MKNTENPMGTSLPNNLTSLKNIYALHIVHYNLFLAKKQLIEVTLTNVVF